MHAAARAAGTAAPCAGCPARCTGLPSSVKPSAPASRSSAISVSASPARPRVTLARKPTGTRASRRAGSRSERSTGARVDRRVGVRHRDDGDEAAGRGRARAGVEVLLVLLPGRAQVHVRVDEAREQVPALAVDAPRRRPAPRASRARRSRRSRRRGRARRAARRCPVRGSSTWAPRTSSRRAASGGGRARSCRLRHRGGRDGCGRGAPRPASSS